MLRSTFFDTRDPHGNFGAEERTRRANRRRLTVFLIVFALFSLVGLIYDYSRPPIYEATARLNLVPATGQRTNDPARPGEQANFLRDEVQFLTSRTLLANVWDRLKGAPVPPPAVSLVDPAASLQTMLSVTPVEGTNVVSMRARGGEPTFLKAFVDRLVAAYQVSVAQRYKIASVDAVVEVRDEARKLEESVAAKRREADAFRARYNIVSLERDENQILSEVKGAGAALNAANDKVVAAEARLGALKDAQEAGQSVTRNKDNSTLAALEQQAAGIRADLKEVARTFTPQYMQIDPRVRSQRERLVEIEQQIVAQRQTSQQGALQEAREELAGARAAAARLRQQLAANQQSVQSFTSRSTNTGACRTSSRVSSSCDRKRSSASPRSKPKRARVCRRSRWWNLRRRRPRPSAHSTRAMRRSCSAARCSSHCSRWASSNSSIGRRPSPPR
ncbi:MAG: GumC family protein [Burkholderiaceae bacterium]